ncbi:MAG TPA: hypothetical protein VE219_05635 [Candidatus Sulfotelmatobacter sp.]|nr:hypothetical protein [Candidatus Sulfotelmatobacter sp.]
MTASEQDPGEKQVLDTVQQRWHSLAEEMASAARTSAAIRELGLPPVLVAGPPHERSTEYILAPSATWAHLLAAEQECLRKPRDDPRVLEAIRRTMERLRTYMEGDPTCTVEKALEHEQAEDASGSA